MNINRNHWLPLGTIAFLLCGVGYSMIGGSTTTDRSLGDESVGRSAPVAQRSPSRFPTATTSGRQKIATSSKSRAKNAKVAQAVFTNDGSFENRGGVIRDNQIQLCQGFSDCATCGQDAGCGCSANAGHAQHVVHAGHVSGGSAHGFKSNVQPYTTPNVKFFAGVDENTTRDRGGEPRWKNADMIPWEAFAFGEYIGPHRQPHVGEYRLRIDDALEFVYILTREKSTEPYRFYVGDQISITSAIDSSIDQPELTILGDGSVSLSLIGQVRVAGKTIRDLQRELNDRYAKFFQNPSVVVQVLQGDTPLSDLLDSVDARAGQGGQSRDAIVSPDGTIQLPLIGSVPAIGLTLKEVAREVNARYRTRIRGFEVTPVLTARAPRFLYVLGEVAQPGQFTLTGPTTAMQAIALAGGFNNGGNLRQIIVFRRDQNYKLTATKLDLSGALWGNRPHPSDEIWLRDSDIVLIPKQPIQRLSEAVNRYLTTTLYAVFPQQGVAFNFDNFTSL